MLRFLGDENFNALIINALRAQYPEVDAVTVQEMKLRKLKDPELLEVAAQQGRMILTHDVRTMPGYLAERVKLGKSTPGVARLTRQLSASDAAFEIAMLAHCSLDKEWEGQVVHLPI